jgi:hypothetical protein
MALGILAIFNNVTPGREADFDRWFQGEHLVERLSVPGFLYGRRHQAISGACRYFNFYVTESPAVLTSKAYLARIDDPTPRTKITMSEIFRDMHRTVCHRDLRLGKVRGGMTVTARFSTPPDPPALKILLEEFMSDETVLGGEIWSSAETTGAAVLEEEKLRGGDRKIRGCLMVDTLHQREAEKIGERLSAQFTQAEVGVFRVLCHIGNSDV